MGIVPVISVKTCATAGNAAALTVAGVYARSVYLEGFGTNTGSIYIGDSTVSSTNYMTKLSAGAGFNLSCDSSALTGSTSGGGELSLSGLYFTSSVNGEKLCVSYVQRVGSN